MKASRAYIAGLGTTGVLLSFALLLLAVFGAILAARGWPEAAADGGAGAVRLDAGEDLTRLEPVRLEAVPASRAARLAAGGRAEDGASGSDRGDVGGVAQGNDASTRAASEPAPAPGAPSASPAAPPVSAPPAAGLPDAPGMPAPGVPAAPGMPAAPRVPAPAPAAPSVDGVAATPTDLVEETGATAERSPPALP